MKAIQDTLSASEDRQRHRDDAGDPRRQERRGSVVARNAPRRSSRRAIEAMKQNRQSRRERKKLYGAMVHAMLSNGGELPTLFFLSGGPRSVQQLVCAQPIIGCRDGDQSDRRDRSEIRRLCRAGGEPGRARRARCRAIKRWSMISRACFDSDPAQHEARRDFRRAVRHLHATRSKCRQRANILGTIR